MSFTMAWLIPRAAFWLLWAAWLFAVQHWNLSGAAILVPPLLATGLGSRWAPNPLDTPGALFWKGAATSCMIALFSELFLFQAGISLLVLAWILLPVCAFMLLRGSGAVRTQVETGDLFEATRAIAIRAGVKQPRLIVFSAPKPSAFAARTGAVLLAEPLLRLLSRRETEAVIAHEVAHLRPANVRWMVLLPLLPAAMVLARGFSGIAPAWAPLWPLAFVWIWNFLRRRQEWDADWASVAITGDGEALITGLARIAAANGMPLDWRFVARLWIGHPPVMSRFRRIAAQCGIAPDRIARLLAEAQHPAGPGYPSPLEAPKQNHLFAEYLRRVQIRIVAWQIASPALAGIAAAAVAIFLQVPAIPLLCAAIALGCLLHLAGLDSIAGSERHRVRARLSPAGSRAHFVGLGLAGEPRLYGGAYHYDFGFVTAGEGSLSFTGAQCQFSIAPQQVSRIWMAQGPPHWLPRKIVCVEYATPRGSAVVSFQSVERWFWPGIAAESARLLVTLRQWAETTAPSQQPAIDPPRADSEPLVPVPMAAAWKSIQIAAGASLAVSWLLMLATFEKTDSLYSAFVAPVVSAAIVLFSLAPNLGTGRAAAGSVDPRSHAAPEIE